MAQQQLTLSEAQVAELQALRDHAARPYLRERAAALLKIAGGASATAVAQHGLLRRRGLHTVLTWLKRYRAEGRAGLTIRPGRGRKPAFFPSDAG
jgi:transposase